ncbi:MAG: 2-amino-4-hydroxy-6-hydroxymethyldihydropteridine diphosphokinase [Acidimicrobiia bacterium]
MNSSGALDRIVVQGLVVTTTVGVLDHEREIPQPLRIDLALHVDARAAGRSDDLGDTANYGDVAVRVANLVRESKDLLLERVAERIAALILDIDRVEGVDVTVAKLRPPIPEQLDSTAVSITRTRRDDGLNPALHARTALIALGSNLGDRAGYLRSAVDALPGVTARSDVFETEPVGGPEGQDAFLNMVVECRTTLDPYALLRVCQRIEYQAQRQRVVHWGPRTLDVDLLFYENITIDDPELIIPHPRIAARRFVLEPLSQIAPERCPDGWRDALPPEAIRNAGPLAELVV